MSTITAAPTPSAYALDKSFRSPIYLPGVSATIIVAADTLGLSFILWLLWTNFIVGRYAAPGEGLRWALLLPTFLLLYYFCDCYPGVSVNPVTEIRRVSLANVCAFFFIAVMLSSKHLAMFPYLMCFVGSIATSVTVLSLRSLARRMGSRLQWWGYPVVLFGRGEVAQRVLRKLLREPHLGLRPVAVIAEDASEQRLEGVPLLTVDQLQEVVSHGVKHAIVAAPELSRQDLADLIAHSGDTIPHLTIIPNTEFVWKVEHARDITGVQGIQCRNNLLDARARAVKRSIDLVSSALLLLLLLPVFALVSLAVMIESGFPVFYFDKRLGNGGIFRMCKFRTMAKNSAEVLRRCLEADPRLREEWAEFQKLRNDPRITRVGKFLRKTSLDEIPQLWNVLRGEMSLVGPRPRVLAVNVPEYQEVNALYAKATPGLTGLWQVSGRSKTTYEERIAYDAYYIRNWSLWMDFHLLAKTVGVVLRGDGAY
jgi:Undecaprenyl-phosphate galactose phosphotransferase WbaP